MSAATVGAISLARSQSIKLRSSAAIISSTRPISCRLLPMLLSTTPRRSSMSLRTIPGTSWAAGSTSRGTAMSTMNSGRWARVSIARCNTSRSSTAPGAVVEQMRMSEPATTFGSSSHGCATASNVSATSCARSSVRLTTATSLAPACAKACAASRPIFPAPTIATRFPDSVSPEKARRASSTAADEIDTGFRPM
jgi:hypothetical protein